MYTTQILCTLRDVKFFLGVFPSETFPRSVTQTGTVINKADPHIEKGSKWLAIHLLPTSTSTYFFDSYGILPLVPGIKASIRHNSTVWDYNRAQLQGLASNACGNYRCPFVLYTDWRCTPKQFIGHIDGASADRQIDWDFASEFGRGSPRKGGG